MRVKNFGGYLPLELKQGKEYYYSDFTQSVLSFNSCKAGIYYALRLVCAKRVYIPHYICTGMFALISSLNVEIRRYHIDKELMPVDLPPMGEGDVLLIVNFFGLVHEKIKQKFLDVKNVIIDNAHAFFAPPVIQDGIFNVYSCMKFVGVPDGGYLVTKKLPDELVHLPMDYSSNHMDFTLQSIEYGTDYAYKSKKENDIRKMTDPRRMSYITHRILMNADYAVIRDRRLSNRSIIEENLGAYNRWHLDGIDFVPYYYPFYYDRPIQDKLIAKGVYTPVLWKELFAPQYDGTLEQEFSKHIIFLPLDQRYDAADMEEMCRRVKECM